MARALRDTLYNFQIEWPPGQNRYFIPEDALNSVITYDNVKKVLDDRSKGEYDLSAYASIISTSAKKIFAVLLYVDQIESIFALIDDGIRDEDLPFTRCYRSSPEGSTSSVLFILCRRGSICDQRGDHQDCGIQEVKKWSPYAISNFCRDQWLVQAPVFQSSEDGSIPHYDLNENVILPFTEDQELQSKQIVSSGYSHVWGVRIHRSHQNLYQAAHGYAPLLAIKRVFSIDPLDFQRERDMLSAVAVRKNPHLIRLLATYHFKGQYHLVFPHAPHNLRGYWNTTSLPQSSREVYLWSLHQLGGIASGLNDIHNFRAKVPLGSQPANQALKVPSGGMLKVAESEEKFGRHGDIKPENILWFNEREGALYGGILQIADMGLGRFHRLDSRSRVDPRGISGSPTYSPPEIALGLDISRAYDIWSLGCVFLEFTTWLLEGGSSIYAFASVRDLATSPGVHDDTFYTLLKDVDGKGHAEVRQGVEIWIDRLRGNGRCSQMISALLDLVQTRMLVIDSRKRIRADALVVELQKILDHALKDELYLLSTRRPASSQTLSVNLQQTTLHPLGSVGDPSGCSSLKINRDRHPNANSQTAESPSIYIQKC